MKYTLSSYEPAHIVLDKPPVPEPMINEEIDRRLEEFSEFEEAEPRPVKFGDYLILTSDNALVAGSPMKPLEMHSGYYHANGKTMSVAFDKALVGMRPGETRHVDVEFGPKMLEDDEPSHLEIDVTVEKILDRTTPALTDEFVREHFAPCEDVAAFRAEVSKEFKPKPMQKSNPRYEELVLDDLAARLVEEIDLADVPRGVHPSNYRFMAAVDALVEHLGITVSDDEIEDLIPVDTAEQRKEIVEEYERQGLWDELISNVTREKGVRWLVEHSTVEYAEE